MRTMIGTCAMLVGLFAARALAQPVAVPVEIARTATLPRAATNGTVALVTWVNEDEGATYARRLDASARFLDAAPIDLSHPGVISDVPAGVFWLVDRFVVVGCAAGGVSLTSLDADTGAVLERRDTTEPCDYRMGAAGRTRGLVVAHDGRTALVDPSPLSLVRAAALAWDPRWIGSNGDDFLVVATSGGTPLLGVRVTSSGVRRDTTPLVLVPSPSASGLVQSASFAWDGAQYLIALRDYRIAIAGLDVNARPTIPATTLRDGSMSPGLPYATAWDDGWLVAWVEPIFPSHQRTYVAQLAADFSVRGSGRLRVTDGTTNEVPAAVVGMGPSALLFTLRDGTTALLAYPLTTLSRTTTTCTDDGECASGACSDGLCCATACGNDPSDCHACSIAAGGSNDGTCTPLTDPTAIVCRAFTGPCDVVEERCVAGSMVCPPGAVGAAHTECRASMGACDPAEVCDGITEVCPPDQIRSFDFVCRVAMGACDRTEYCQGEVTCPADLVEGAGRPCRPTMSLVCDPLEVCDGTSPQCPADVIGPDDVACVPWMPCTGAGRCRAGRCVGPTIPSCDAGMDAGFIDVTPLRDAGPSSDDDTSVSDGDVADDASTSDRDAREAAIDAADAGTPDAAGGCGCRIGDRHGSSVPVLALVAFAARMVRRRVRRAR